MNADELNRIAREEHPDGATLAEREAIALESVDRLRTAEQYIGALPNSVLYGVADAIEEYVMRRHGIEGVPQPTWLLEFLYESGLTVVPGGPYKDRAAVDCGTCNGSGIAPDYSPEPDDEQPCPECVTEKVR